MIRQILNWGEFVNKKNTIEVIINNKQYTLSGYESAEYLQKLPLILTESIVNIKRRTFSNILIKI